MKKQSTSRQAIFSVGILTATLLTAPFTSASAAEGGVVGDGGSTVRAENGRIVPADAYFAARDFKLPEGYVKVDFTKYPQLLEELEAIRVFIQRRSAKKEPVFSIPFEQYEIYETDHLSGEDPLPVTEGLRPIPTTYTYQFTESSPDFSVRKIRRVIEILPDPFRQMSARDQALQLAHELLHNEWTAGHDIIAPFLKDLRHLLEVDQRQRKDAGQGVPLPISEAEYTASRRFQNVLFHFAKAPTAWSIDRNGGGLILSYAERTTLVQNTIGISSTVTFSGSYKDSSLELRDNLVIDSALVFEKHLYKKSLSCVGNRFISFATDGYIICNGTGNRFEHVSAQTMRIEIYGNRNVFQNSQIANGGGNITISGDESSLKDSIFRGLELGPAAIVENSEIHAYPVLKYSKVEGSLIQGMISTNSTSVNLQGCRIDVRSINIFRAVTVTNLQIRNGSHIELTLKPGAYDFSKDEPYDFTGIKSGHLTIGSADNLRLKFNRPTMGR